MKRVVLTLSSLVFCLALTAGCAGDQRGKAEKPDKDIDVKAVEKGGVSATPGAGGAVAPKLQPPPGGGKVQPPS
jgi:hypothetical protein